MLEGHPGNTSHGMSGTGSNSLMKILHKKKRTMNDRLENKGETHLDTTLCASWDTNMKLPEVDLSDSS